MYLALDQIYKVAAKYVGMICYKGRAHLSE